MKQLVLNVPVTDGSKAVETSPKPDATVEKGRKFDAEKPRWDLLPWKPLNEVAKVLTFGARKYADDNWKKVPRARKRYLAAALRHLAAWGDGERNDPETGLNHLAHAACCVLFLAWFDLTGTPDPE